MREAPYYTAFAHAGNHRTELLASEQCGCYYCMAIYPPDKIEEWCDSDEDGIGQTAICPRCGIDAVLGSRSGFSITEQFLREMHQVWFSTQPNKKS